MTRWLLIPAALFALGACAAWFLSTRPILYTRIFVSHEERPLVRREILADRRFERRMRRISALQLLIGLGCLAAAFFTPQ
jgi:hypothetical protein